MRPLDVKMNAVNGGSFAVTAVRKADSRRGIGARDRLAARAGGRHGADTTTRPIAISRSACIEHRADLRRLLQTLAADGKKVIGYGASTKGNVVLQFCGVTRNEVAAIAEVNPDKFGAFTPVRTSRSFPKPRRGHEARLFSCAALALQGRYPCSARPSFSPEVDG